MRSYVHTFKRVASGLRMAGMVLIAVVAYAAFLKRGRGGQKLFSLLILAGTVASSTVACWSIAAEAKAPVKPVASKAVPKGPPKQIFTRSDRPSRSEILGVDAKAAYVLSALGTNSGILITSVSPSSMAGRIGVSEGDVLLSINQRVVTTPRDADRILGDIATGNIKVSFAHPSDNGLQLYNVNVAYTHQGAPAGGSSYTASSSGSGKPGNAAQLAAQIPSAESHVVGVVNADRAREKSGPVDSNGALSSLARAHAQDMATRKFFNHVNPDGLSPQDRARNAGVGGVFENISYASDVFDLNAAADNAERQMMSEPPNQQNHRSNIIDPAHKTVGIGIAVSKDGTFFMVQEFSNGSP